MRRFSPTVIAIIFFVVLDSFVFYATYLKHVADHKPIQLSAPAPDFAWKAFDGSSHSLKELAGHPVVLHFWASWCEPCREEFPRLLKAAAENKDVMFLTIASDETLEKPKQYVTMAPKLSGINAPANVLYAWDPDKAITYDLFFTSLYPESILIDAKQNLRRKFPGAVDWESEVVRSYLKEAK